MKKILTALLALIALNLTSTPALAWWETGHMITAWIAYQELRPAVRQEADRLIQLMTFADDHPAKRHFVPVSVWMDDIKARGLRTFDNWHYANVPYNPEGLLQVPDVPESNILSQLEKLAKTLKHPKATDFEKAFALRILIHLFGDIHQPFHAVGRISHAHPQGDQGGNLVPLEGVEAKNLHAFWDSTAGFFPSVKPEHWQSKIPEMGRTLMQRWPRQKLTDQLAFAPQNWLRESFRLAVEAGYGPLTESRVLSPEYIRQAQEICQERLVLGGYRLAEFLNEYLLASPPN